MNTSKPLFKPRFTPVPPSVDIPALVHATPNFHWASREDARLHSAPFHQLNQRIHAVTIEQGLPIVVDNWHLRNDWNAAVFSKEWLDREHGNDDIVVRDLVKAQDIAMSVSYYLSQVPGLAGQDFMPPSGDVKGKPPRRQYGKDIDCPPEWRTTLAEILPSEISYLGGNDLMTKLPPDARAENMMIYIGHEGTYTPAHKDMCATYAQNIMVATSPSPNGVEGLAYWFIFSARDRKRLADYWNTLGHDIDTENFFASIDDLRGFPGNVWVVEQRIGDFVIIPPLGAHQVYNHGGMTIKAAWNRTTIDTLELSLHETLPAYRHVCRDEQYKNKAIIHQSLLELSRFPPQTLISSPFKHDSFMRLFRLYTSLLVDEFIPADSYRGIHMEKIPQQFNVACSFCRTNIWNRFLTCRGCHLIDKDGDIDTYDICLECFSRGRSCRDITGLEWVQQEKWSELMGLWERCRGIYQFLGGDDIDVFDVETSISLGRKTLAGVCVEELLRRPNPHRPQTIKEGLCHTCKIRHPVWKMVHCTQEGCNRAYCFGNLFRQFDEDPFDVLCKVEGFTCPVCRGICNCGACRKRKDQVGYEPKLRSVGINPKLVADKRSVESLVDTNRTNTRWHLETKGKLSTKTDDNDDHSSSIVFDRTPNAETESYPTDSNLDPALLDPEMASYFFGASQQDDPPPYTEQHNLSQPMLIDEPEPSNSWIPFESFDIYTAQPLSDSLDPTLFAPEPIRQTSEIFSQTHPSLIEEQSTSISISPALLDKSSTAQKEVIWYSSATGKQIGGKKPPRHTAQGKGKTPKPRVQKELGPQYEVTVETGLDTVKRIKLLFRDDSSVEPRSMSESQSALEMSDTPGKRIKWFERRVTPPAAIMSGQPIPNARDLHLDDNTPPLSSAPASPTREVAVDVVVLEKKIDKDLYPVFLAKDARQVMIRSKNSGRVKGIIYSWE